LFFLVRPVVSTLLWLLVLCPSLFAQLLDVGELNVAGAMAFRSGDYGAAERAFRLALQTAEERRAPATQRATTLANLAEVLSAEGAYGESEHYFQRALQVAGTEPIDSEFRALVLPNLAGLYARVYRWREAESVLDEALMLSQQHFAKQSPTVAVVLNKLAIVYANTGRVKDAERTLKRTITMMETCLGAEHADLPFMLSSLAAVYIVQNDLKNAESLLLRAVRIQEQFLTPNHPDRATVLHDLGIVHLAQGRWRSAEQLFRRSLDIRQQSKNMLDVALSRGMLAVALAAQNENTEAKSLLQIAIAEQEQALGARVRESRDFVWTLEQYARVLRKLGEREAEPVEARAKDLRFESMYTVSVKNLKK
jgi:tetratricopeptide (TPR) repeat protein